MRCTRLPFTFSASYTTTLSINSFNIGFVNSFGIRILKETIVSLKEQEHEKIKATVGKIDKVNINAPLYFSFLDKLLPTLIKLNKKQFEVLITNLL
jgi:hypothetical protein